MIRIQVLSTPLVDLISEDFFLTPVSRPAVHKYFSLLDSTLASTPAEFLFCEVEFAR